MVLPGPTAHGHPVPDAVQAQPLSGQSALARSFSRAADSKRFVIAISIDGLNPDAIRSLGVQGTPALHRMMDEGAGTLNARSAYEQTKTLPNHTGMLSGRRVAGKKGHGVDFNDDNGSNVHRTAGRYVSSLFDVVHNRGRNTALLTSKDKFAFFNRSWGPKLGARDTVGADDGRDKIDRYVYDDSAALVDRLVKRMRDKRPWAATFLHIALPDLAGHEHGFMSDKYLAAVTESDRLVGRILDTVAGSAYLSTHVDVVLTADHGGDGVGHYDANDPADYTVPFLTWGVDVEAGANLYDLNPERTSPGDGRPRYQDDPPVRNTDVGSLVTALLGFPAVPGGLLPDTTPLEVS